MKRTEFLKGLSTASMMASAYACSDDEVLSALSIAEFTAGGVEGTSATIMGTNFSTTAANNTVAINGINICTVQRFKIRNHTITHQNNFNSEPVLWTDSIDRQFIFAREAYYQQLRNGGDRDSLQYTYRMSAQAYFCFTFRNFFNLT
jgi:hypothetical protein